MVSTFWVTSSPTRPSPRVAARTSQPLRRQSDGQSQAVDLGLDGEVNGTRVNPVSLPRVRHHVVSSSAPKTLSRLSIGSSWVTGENVVESGCANATRHRLLVGQLGVRSLEVPQFAHECVVVTVGQRRLVVDEVGLVVPRDLLAQLGDAKLGVHRSETIAAPSTTDGSSTRYITTDWPAATGRAGACSSSATTHRRRSVASCARPCALHWASTDAPSSSASPVKLSVSSSRVSDVTRISSRRPTSTRRASKSTRAT